MTAITTSASRSGDGLAVRVARARQAVAGAAATAAGRLARQVTSLPGVAGAGCAVAAAWDAAGRPAGLAVLAVALLLLDRRMP